MMKVSMAAAALALTGLFSTAAMAKEIALTGCTADGHMATLKVNIRDETLATNPALPALLQSAWAGTTANLSAKALAGRRGSRTFLVKAAKTIDNDLLDSVAPIFPPAIDRAHACTSK